MLLEIIFLGFCHSDLQVWDGQFEAQLQMIPLHEPAGKIFQVGSKANGSWKVGDRVGLLNIKKACGECVGCRQYIRRKGRTDPRFCEKREVAGFKHDSAFAEYVIADPATIVHLPDEIPYEQGAPLMCAGATVWGALQKLKPEVQSGEAVAIVSIGGLGQLGIQFSKAMGFKTIAINNREEGRRLATEVSSNVALDLVIDSSASNASDKLMEFTAGEGLAGVVVCTDSIPANTWSLRQLGNGGVMVPVGLPKKTLALTIRGAYLAGRDQVEEMLKIVTEYNVTSHITTVGFDQIPTLVERYADPSMKWRLVVKIAQ
ncbi:GroES-like protein [Bimuria novae-zelandiae CBS 107.79]|uniref:GroES-like protein n=1 Tax=Bimuria novae-zelandiae CBS 107.79 TaxID=1447943 RepID=A0A6A5VFB6_9PLEO|nr:GroES-like protein [Bimuria novae-zelandiae CBS 107.79]